MQHQMASQSTPFVPKNKKSLNGKKKERTPLKTAKPIPEANDISTNEDTGLEESQISAAKAD